MVACKCASKLYFCQERLTNQPKQTLTLMEISAIKSRLSIESVLTHYGLSADRNGMLPCPFHEDGTPSMQLYATTVYCFSTNCAQHGKNIDAIDFIL
jgi:DNA primase